MKKYIISSVAVMIALALVWSAFGQPPGDDTGGRRGGMGQMSGMRGDRMMSRAEQRPNREERLAAIKTLEKQIAALKAEIEKAPASDPNIATLEGDTRTKFMTQYTEELNAVNAIQQTLATMTGRGGRSRFGFFGGGADTLSELRVLANSEKAAKTVARLDELIQQEQTRASRRGQMGERQGQRQRGQRGARQQ